METRNWIEEFDTKFKGRITDAFYGDGGFISPDGRITPIQDELKRFIQSIMPLRPGVCTGHKYFVNPMNNKIECGHFRYQPQQFY